MSVTSIESLLEDEHVETVFSTGLLVVFEGLDKTGKSTHAKQLHKRLEADGYSSSLYSFPSDSNPIGQLLRRLITTKGLPDAPINIEQQIMNQLFSTERLYMSHFIQQDLDDGKIVLLDRYFYSAFAYNYVEGEDLSQSDQTLPIPDLMFLFTDHPPTSPKPELEDDMYKYYQPRARSRYLQLLQPDTLPPSLREHLPVHTRVMQYRSPFNIECKDIFTLVVESYLEINDI